MEVASFCAVAAPVVVQHTARQHGQEYQYRSIVGATLVPDRAGQGSATMFSFSYVRATEGQSHRPVLFIFNGGPGASSLYCHLGGLGPYRATFAVPPSGLQYRGAAVPNEDSLLLVADLVFIDPPDTGYARVMPGKEADYFGIDADARACSYFIKKWLTDNQRWLSPTFILGESYGTLRAAALSQELAGSVADGMLHGVALDGVILLGQALNLGPANAGNTDLPYAFSLPSQIALAWHHGRSSLSGLDHADILREASEFVAAEYLPALFRGAALPESDMARLAQALASMTGIAAEVWKQAGLRLSAAAFAAKLLAHDNKWISLYDGRYTFDAPRHAFDPVADDPALTAMAVSCQMALQDHLPQVLGYVADSAYKVINFKVNGAWDFRTRHSPGTSLDMSQVMATSLQRNPSLRLLVCSGAYDLTTPFASAEYMLGRGNFPADRITHAVYASGHSPFMTDAARRDITADIGAFVLGAALPGRRRQGGA